MTTRTMLITVPGSDDPESCGECPFLCRGVIAVNDCFCGTGFDGWRDSIGPDGRRHAACLDAERAAKAANDALVLAAIRAGRTTPIPPEDDRSRLREVHEHLTAHGLPALERMDKEDADV